MSTAMARHAEVRNSVLESWLSLAQDLSYLPSPILAASFDAHSRVCNPSPSHRAGVSGSLADTQDTADSPVGKRIRQDSQFQIPPSGEFTVSPSILSPLILSPEVRVRDVQWRCRDGPIIWRMNSAIIWTRCPALRPLLSLYASVSPSLTEKQEVEAALGSGWTTSTVLEHPDEYAAKGGHPLHQLGAGGEESAVRFTHILQLESDMAPETLGCLCRYIHTGVLVAPVRLISLLELYRCARLLGIAGLGAIGRELICDCVCFEDAEESFANELRQGLAFVREYQLLELEPILIEVLDYRMSQGHGTQAHTQSSNAQVKHSHYHQRDKVGEGNRLGSDSDISFALEDLARQTKLLYTNNTHTKSIPSSPSAGTTDVTGESLTYREMGVGGVASQVLNISGSQANDVEQLTPILVYDEPEQAKDRELEMSQPDDNLTQLLKTLDMETSLLRSSSSDFVSGERHVVISPGPTSGLKVGRADVKNRVVASGVTTAARKVFQPTDKSTTKSRKPKPGGIYTMLLHHQSSHETGAPELFDNTKEHEMPRTQPSPSSRAALLVNESKKAITSGVSSKSSLGRDPVRYGDSGQRAANIGQKKSVRRDKLTESKMGSQRRRSSSAERYSEKQRGSVLDRTARATKESAVLISSDFAQESLAMPKISSTPSKSLAVEPTSHEPEPALTNFDGSPGVVLQSGSTDSVRAKIPPWSDISKPSPDQLKRGTHRPPSPTPSAVKPDWIGPMDLRSPRRVASSEEQTTHVTRRSPSPYSSRPPSPSPGSLSRQASMLAAEASRDIVSDNVENRAAYAQLSRQIFDSFDGSESPSILDDFNVQDPGESARPSSSVPAHASPKWQDFKDSNEQPYEIVQDSIRAEPSLRSSLTLLKSKRRPAQGILKAESADGKLSQEEKIVIEVTVAEEPDSADFTSKRSLPAGLALLKKRTERQEARRGQSAPDLGQV